LLERGFNSGGLSWLTPALGTVDALAPIDAQPPNLREEMCGGHRRKPPSEENQEEEPTTAAAQGSESESGQAFLLSSLKPANGKFVLGPPVETTPPVVVFTGPADHPDTAAQVASAPSKKKKKKVAATPATGEKSAKAAKPVKSAKPKVTSAAQ
jgi:D-alanyl-D-alanine carboxypeptidase